jgi:ribosomal protein S7
LKYELKIHEGLEPFWIFLVALMKVTPEVLLFPKKRGGGLQWIPLPISERKQYTFAIKWIIKLLKDKFRVIKIQQVVEVLVGAIYGNGLAIEKKNSVHAIADMNRHLVRFFR